MLWQGVRKEKKSLELNQQFSNWKSLFCGKLRLGKGQLVFNGEILMGYIKVLMNIQWKSYEMEIDRKKEVIWFRYFAPIVKQVEMDGHRCKYSSPEKWWNDWVLYGIKEEMVLRPLMGSRSYEWRFPLNQKNDKFPRERDTAENVWYGYEGASIHFIICRKKKEKRYFRICKLMEEEYVSIGKIYSSKCSLWLCC